MSTPANLSEQILALPNGAGSVRSAGQTFQADPYSGTGRYTIPIETQPGHAGLTPALSLTYSTHGGNGIAGMGWSLGLARVERRTDKGLPSFDDERDTFTLQGDELLSVGAGAYRLRIEKRFARIRHVRQPGRNVWVVTERDGTRVFYGLESDHRLHDGFGKVAAWYVSKKQDAHGNEVVFAYTRDATTHDVRLASVTWAGCYRVTFDYEERPDPIVSYRAGFEQQQLHRLARIDIEVKRTSTGAYHTYRRCALRYATSPLTGRSLLARVTVTGINPDGSTHMLPPLTFGYSTADLADRTWHDVTGALPGSSLQDRNLTLVRQSGSGLPDLLETTATGHWLRENLGHGRFGSPRRVESPAQVLLERPGTFISDMSGDGQGDLVVDGGRRVYRGIPGGGWGTPYTSAQAPSVDLEAADVRVADLNGDGLPDALRSGIGSWVYFENLGQGAWTPGFTLVKPPAVRLDDPRVHLVDVNGDGLPDLVYVERGRIMVWPGQGRGHFGAPYLLGNAPDFGPSFDPAAVRWADLTNSGQADLIYSKAGQITVCLNQAGQSLTGPIGLASMFQSSHGHVEPVDLLGTGATGLLFSDQQGRPGAWRYLDLFPAGPPDLLSHIDNGIGAITRLSYTSSAAHWVRDRLAGQPWHTTMPSPQLVVDTVTSTDAVTGVTLGLSYRYHHGVYDGEEREFRGFGQVEQLDREADADDPQPLSQMLVRRWYHTGFDVDLRHEYAPLPEAALADDIPRLPWALRSLRGQLCREETYALDGDPRPYLIGETAYQVFPVQRALGGQRYSFAPLPIRTRMTHSERTHERRVVETTTTYDLHSGRGYGLPVEVRERGIGRHGSFTTAHEQQQSADLTRSTVTSYVNRDEPDGDDLSVYSPHYLVGKPGCIERYGMVQGRRELFSREIFFYDGEAYEGLGYPGRGTEPGVTRGRLSSKLALAFSDDLLAAVYPAGAGASAAFSTSGNYLSLSTEHYLHAERYRYDDHGTVTGIKSPNGHESSFEYDETYRLFPIEYTDPAGHPMRLSRGELPFQVEAVLDANGNTTQFSYDPTGLQASKSVQGKFVAGAWQGDPPTHPTEQYGYDFTTTPMKIVVKTRQERLGTTVDVTRYVDGLGRTIQERHTAEPDPRTGAQRYRVTGWQVFNHKGLVVKAYQPVFAETDAYSPGDTTTACVETRYDPLGRPVRVDYPDGTFETTAYHPWMQTAADRNDNAGHLTHSDPRYGEFLAQVTPHLDTPRRTYIDAFGRSIAVAEDNGGEIQVTHSVLDLKDQVIEVWDARGLPFATWPFAYDLAGRRIYSNHATALGQRYMLADAAGNPVWARDARDIEILRSFDARNRPLQESTDDGTGRQLRRQWRYVAYDESHPDFEQYRARNLFGQIEEVRDADGLRFFVYDWRGLATSVGHRFWSQEDSGGRPWDDDSSEMWTAGAAWDPAIPAAERDDIQFWLVLSDLSDPTTLLITTNYDAASRPIEVIYPEQMRMRNVYNTAGLLDAIEVDRGSGEGYRTVVQSLTYNARGQLIYLQHGNGVETMREHDEDLQRLKRIFTRLVGTSTTDFQDLVYDYDPVGNPLQITDRLSQSAFTHNRIIPNTRTFAYDPRYRLIRATGKKHRTIQEKTTDAVIPSPNPNDYEPYSYVYAYDAVGNLTRNQEYTTGPVHYKADRIDLFNGDDAEAGGFTDPAAGNFRYDANGNTTHTPRHEEFVYSHDNQVRYANLNGGGQVRYLQHGDQRVVRLVKKNGVKALTLYLGPFEYHLRQGTTSYTKLVLQVEGHGRHAQVERVLAGSDPKSLERFFQHSDHLGSGHVLTRDDGDLLNQEEYFPYGRASDRREARNRYRFIGVEQDEDTHLCMTGPRTYDPVSGRFLQGDPLSADHTERTPMSYPPGPISASDTTGYDIELLIGSSFTDQNTGAVERYGHTAIRVVGDTYDYTYDFGRYGARTGEFGAQGEGILRQWVDFDSYIRLQNSKGTSAHHRTTTGYRIPTHPTLDKAVMDFFAQHMQQATPQGAKPGIVSTYRLQDDYHGLFFNCSTLSVDAFERAIPRIDLDVTQQIQGRGLTQTEKSVAQLRGGGWPQEVFTPEDLKAVLDQLSLSEPSMTIEQWSRQTGTTPQVIRQGVENVSPPEWYPAMGTQPVPTE
jgi:RHS repeat-associated protein